METKDIIQFIDCGVFCRCHDITPVYGTIIVSKIGNIFKPKIENNIRNSFNERNNKNKNKINYNLLSLIDNK